MGRSLSLLFYLTLWMPIITWGQSADSLLQKANQLYERDQLDSAVYYYKLVQDYDPPGLQLRALSGQVKVEVARSQMDAASTLIEQADALLLATEIDSESICRYKTMKAEYYRSDSQFEKALTLHQEVVQQSAREGLDSLIYGNALYYTGLTYERLEIYDSSLVYVERAYAIFQQALDTTTLHFQRYGGVLLSSGTDRPS